MAKKRKASSLDTPTYHLAIISPIALPVPQRSQREIATQMMTRGAISSHLIS
jgi:hypothetical protein